MPRFFKLKQKSIHPLVENYRIKFGAYKGNRLQEVEDYDYLHWYRDTVSSHLDRKIIDVYHEARGLYGRTFPKHMHEQHFTKWILARREKRAKSKYK